ncbi:glycosyltransferase family 4 protein [Acinetobacter sp. DSM 11652]|uniref:glycosyltransferase family 4 protein n=1 Tax=Acinetobacter sp. DSM 11652 TaxID=346222 RepID=UPI0008D42C43|nr:glycosyltransferase family 1 protein [Acinetobacter sp. DSM 11652]SEM02882.1 hypothetical protein SAMN05216500_109139 [Acinetobacter sp. DSM 11652]
MALLNLQVTQQKKLFELLDIKKNPSFEDFILLPDADQPKRHPQLKIAIVTETWSPEINGVANSLMNLCLGLQKRGHQILLIRPQPKVKCKRFKPDAECWVHAQAIPKYPTLQFGWPQFSKISKAVEVFQPDIVHIVTEGPLGFASLMVAKSQNIPVSSGFHSAFQEFSRYFDFPFLVKPISKYLTWFHNKTDVTCVPSLDTQHALKQMGVSGELRVVGRGVDTQLFNPNKRSKLSREQWTANEHTRVLISVGRLSPEKEVDLIIRTFLKMKGEVEHYTKLVIVGDGPDRVRLEALANHHPDIIFMGSLTGEDLACAYASADVFIFPSQVETFGNVALEALASGLPVVAYDYACAKLHVVHNETGWLIPLGDLDMFERAMTATLNQPDLKIMGEKAHLAVAATGWLKPVIDFEQALFFAVHRTLFH